MAKVARVKVAEVAEVAKVAKVKVAEAAVAAKAAVAEEAGAVGGAVDFKHIPDFPLLISPLCSALSAHPTLSLLKVAGMVQYCAFVPNVL